MANKSNKKFYDVVVFNKKDVDPSKQLAAAQSVASFHSVDRVMVKKILTSFNNEMLYWIWSYDKYASQTFEDDISIEELDKFLDEN